MNEPMVWHVLLWLVVGVLLTLPFYPAWSEWRHPIDRHALPAHLPARTQALPASLQLAPGASFGQVQAQRLLLGSGPMPLAPDEPALSPWQPPASASPWGAAGWRIGQRLDIGAHRRVPGSLVVLGRLNMLGPGRIEGDLKVHKDLHLGAGVCVQGNLLGEGDIWLDTGCQVHGLVVTEGVLHLAPGVVIGTPGTPASVCARVIEVQGPVLVHGSVLAREGGQVALS